MHTETGPGVYETAIHHADPLLAADMAALFKTTLKVLCARHGCSVTFMAKWHPDLPGSSGHIHQSLWSADGGENLFAGPESEYGLSELGQRYLAGLMTLSTDLTAVFSPTINSYKRFVPGMWAPLSPSWDVENRTCSIRVINGPGRNAARLELRQTAADINPYLAIAASLAAGLYGIERALPLSPPSRGDASAQKHGPVFPRSLGAAAEAMANSQLVRQVLPEAFVEHYTRTRDWEVRQHGRSVSHWELERYFEAI
jgi:glutamine synthetase